MYVSMYCVYLFASLWKKKKKQPWRKHNKHDRRKQTNKRKKQQPKKNGKCKGEKQTNKQTNKQIKYNLAASHPSVKGQKPKERWIGVYTGNHRRHPLPSPIFRLRTALPVTGVLTVCRRGRRESILYAGAEPATRLLGRQHSARSSQLPAKTVFKFNNYTPTRPAEIGCAR